MLTSHLHTRKAILRIWSPLALQNAWLRAWIKQVSELRSRAEMHPDLRLTQILKHAELVRLDRIAAAIEMVHGGKVDTYAAPRVVLLASLHRSLIAKQVPKARWRQLGVPYRVLGAAQIPDIVSGRIPDKDGKIDRSLPPPPLGKGMRAHIKLRVETRKWLLANLPKRVRRPAPMATVHGCWAHLTSLIMSAFAVATGG